MSHLAYEKQGHVAVITFNRPERHNAISPEMMVRLFDAWTEVRDDPEVRVAILTGAGDETFCAGGDLGKLMPLFTGAREPEDEWDRRIKDDPMMTMTSLLKGFELYKPIVAAVNGRALAGGMELLQATDIRVASSEAVFGLTEAQRGLVPGGGSMVRLCRQIPWARAMEILLLGETITAEEALDIGLINAVVAPDQVMAAAHDYAERLAANGPLAVQKIKEAGVAHQRPAHRRGPRHRERPGGRGDDVEGRPRGPAGLHGEAPPELHRHLIRRSFLGIRPG